MTQNKQYITKKEFEKFRKDLAIGLLLISIVLVSFPLIIDYVEDNKPEYSYSTKIIELNNTNIIQRLDVVEYVCDEGVYIYNPKRSDFFYASTWEGDSDRDGTAINGKCMIKIRERIR